MKALEFLIGCMIVGALSASVASGGDAVPSAPFCGINSLYSALRIEQFDTDFAALRKSKYVGSPAGSTISELQVAAREQGAYCEVLTNLSISDLRQLDCPAILHVKNEYDAPEYNHFLLCVPVGGGRVALYDPPDPVVQDDGSELAALWGGTAILVSAKPVRLLPIYWRGGFRVLLGTAGLSLIAVGVATMRRRGWHPKRVRLGPGGQSAVVFLLTVSLGGGYQWCSKQGFLAQHAATAAITAAFNEEAADIVDLPRAQLMRIGGAQFIDARSASDFAAGHVDGSINIPPNATRLDRSTCLAGVVKDRPLVVYCQGPSCPNARVLAARLSRDGYRRISIFGGGWSAWDAAGASSFSDVPLLGSRP